MNNDISFSFKMITTFVLIFFCLISYAHPGFADSTFGQNGFVAIAPFPLGHAQIRASVALDDGKILLAGGGWGSTDYTASLVRFNANGSPDYSFGIGGVLMPNLPGISLFTSIVLQPDGKILCAGNIDFDSDTEKDILIIRMNPDGSYDSTFGTNGLVTIITDAINEDIHALALQDDGKIVVAGSIIQSLTKDFFLARFDSDGNLDETFSADGIVITGAAEEEEAFSLVIQEDGKIVAVGYTGQLGTEDFALVRYNTDGSLDATFSDDGIVATGGGWHDRAQAALLQEDGKIVAAGYSVDGTTGLSIFSLARYTTLGNLDPDFGTGGIQILEIGTSCQLFSACLQTDQKIVVAGVSDVAGGDPEFTLARYTTAGILDSDFGTGGIANATFGESSVAFSVLVQDNGNIIASGICFIPPVPFQLNAVANFKNDGTLNPEFDSDGMADIGAGNSISTPLEVLVQEDGKILTVGSVNNGLDDDGFMMRNNPDGSFDVTFDSDGLLILDGGSDEIIRSAVIKYTEGIADKIYFVGEQELAGSYHLAIGSLNIDGTMDPAFAGGSPLIVSIGTDDNATDIDIMNNGNIIVSGYSDDGSNVDFVLVSVTSDGVLNSEFDADGIATTDIGPIDILSDIELQNDGKIVAAGFFDDGTSKDFCFLRYNTDGTLDPDFGTEGIFVIRNEDDELISDIAIQPDGKIIAAGNSDNGTDNTFAIIRINANGSLDTTFGSRGIILQNMSGESMINGAQTVQLESNGKILITGNSSSESGLPEIVTLRMNTDGSMDEMYGSDGYAITLFQDKGAIAITSVITEDDKLIVAGILTNKMENKIVGLFQYNADDPPSPIALAETEIKTGISIRNFPNPFAEATTIDYYLPETLWVTIKLYDISGNEIKTLVNGQMSAGNHDINLMSSGLKNGIYLYRLTCGKYSVTKKLVINL